MRQDLLGDLQQLPAEQIKQIIIAWLGADDNDEELRLIDLEQQLSVEVKNSQDSQQLSKSERLAAVDNWVESHREKSIPFLSDEAISRESIYEDRV